MAYHHLTVAERTQIAFGLSQNLSVRIIARTLGRSPATVSREIRRNKSEDRTYKVTNAHTLAIGRRAAARPRRLNDPDTWAYVFERLLRGWSPEQIQGRARLEGASHRFSARTIYRHFHLLRKAHPELLKYLPRGPRKRRKKPVKPLRGLPLSPKTIDERPLEVLTRGELGHWEADTLVGSVGVPSVVVLVERKSRYIVARKLDHPGAVEVAAKIINALGTMRKSRRKTITTDNGREFLRFVLIEGSLSVSVYFTHPASPHEKPTVENTNGLLRDYLPKKMNLRKLSVSRLKLIVRSLNHRPRRCLNWRTPAEVFRSS